MPVWREGGVEPQLLPWSAFPTPGNPPPEETALTIPRGQTPHVNPEGNPHTKPEGNLMRNRRATPLPRKYPHACLEGTPLSIRGHPCTHGKKGGCYITCPTKRRSEILTTAVTIAEDKRSINSYAKHMGQTPYNMRHCELPEEWTNRNAVFWWIRGSSG
ncbi:hypothetical protein EI94DRAFT_1740561 [Lactarius quietus]|nr:hypothetical protein EI94DRAFT_1740561 [Lactarius quietus]